MSDIIPNKELKTAGDWVDRFLTLLASKTKEVERVVMKEGKPVKNQAGENIKEKSTVPDGVDVDKLWAMADKNKFEPKIAKERNPGLHRMNIGNALRARAKRRHGLFDHTGKWHDADEDFRAAYSPRTEEKDGSKIPVAKTDEKEAA